MELKKGKFLIKEARKVIETSLNGKSYETTSNEPWLNEKKGLFVTLEKYPSKMLRGCIGFAEPIFPIKKALVKAAKGAALKDFRFHPLRKDELKNIIIEISILTEPKKLEYKTQEELLSKIKIGKHGLIIELDYKKGLLLPQVPVEFNWNVEEFLEHTSMKAGLAFTAWKNPRVKIYTFKSIIFKEKKPLGEVIRLS